MQFFFNVVPSCEETSFLARLIKMTEWEDQTLRFYNANFYSYLPPHKNINLHTCFQALTLGAPNVTRQVPDPLAVLSIKSWLYIWTGASSECLLEFGTCSNPLSHDGWISTNYNKLFQFLIQYYKLSQIWNVWASCLGCNFKAHAYSATSLIFYGLDR